MQGWWVIEAFNNSPAYLASWVFWVIFSICLHELGHGWAAIWQGDRTPIERGHMTWNPFIHMGPMSLLLFALFGFAWGAMPVNAGRFRSRYGDAMVSAAGPLMNLILAVFCLAAIAVLVRIVGINTIDTTGVRNLLMFLTAGLWLNLVLMMFNLFPIPPLDGSRILGDFFPPYARFFGNQQGNFAAVFGFAILFIFVSPYIQRVAMIATRELIGWAV
jgi:Zn-dependent protease